MLSTGCWQSIMNNEYVKESIMQVLSFQMISSGDNEKYRLHLSDGQNSYSFVMLSSQLNDMVITGILSKFAIVWITEYTISKLTNSSIDRSTPVVIIVDLIVLVSGVLVGFKIGNPTSVINSEIETSIFDPFTILNENYLLQCFDIF